MRRRLVGFREFPGPSSLRAVRRRRIVGWAGSLDVQAVICTHKDLVKLRLEQLGGKPLWALDIEIDFLAGRSELESQLAALLPIGEPG